LSREFGLTASSEQRFGDVPGDTDPDNPFAWAGKA
jgi:hypothetical protein